MDRQLCGQIFQFFRQQLQADLWTWLRSNRRYQVSDTFANRLRVIPVGIPGADALDDRGALLQRVAGVAGELNHSSNTIERVGGGEVAVLEVRLVAVAALKGWRRKWNARQRRWLISRTQCSSLQRQRRA